MRRIGRFSPRDLARRAWQIHPPVALAVAATRMMTMQTLATATRPSQDRLHLRDLFTGGRRYYVQPIQAGFRLTSDTGQYRNGRRRRTRPAAIVQGALSALGDESSSPITLIRLSAKMHPFTVIQGLLFPLFVALIVLMTGWEIPLRIGFIVGLLSLAILGYRFNAAYGANEMIYFVQKVLEDLPPGEIPQLGARGADVIVQPRDRDFAEAWQRFYEEQTQG